MTGYAVTPTQQDVFAVLQPFIMAVTGLAQNLVIQGLGNRTPLPPAVPGFIAMTPTLLRRLRTNVDTWDTTNPAPTTISSEVGMLLRVQIDCYGPTSGDWAAQLCAMFRDENACTALEPTCDPLYADEPRMAPLIDTEEQYEQRWILEAFLQYNPVTSVPAQFADEATVTLVNVDKAYPP